MAFQGVRIFPNLLRLVGPVGDQANETYSVWSDLGRVQWENSLGFHGVVMRR